MRNLDNGEVEPDVTPIGSPRCQAEVWRTQRHARRCINQAQVERVCPGPHGRAYPILLCEVHNRIAALKPIFAYPDGDAPLAIWVDSPKGVIV